MGSEAKNRGSAPPPPPEMGAPPPKPNPGYALVPLCQFQSQTDMDRLAFALTDNEPYVAKCTVGAYGRDLHLANFTPDFPECLKPGLSIQILQLANPPGFSTPDSTRPDWGGAIGHLFDPIATRFPDPDCPCIVQYIQKLVHLQIGTLVHLQINKPRTIYLCWLVSLQLVAMSWKCRVSPKCMRHRELCWQMKADCRIRIVNHLSYGDNSTGVWRGIVKQVFKKPSS